MKSSVIFRPVLRAQVFLSQVRNRTTTSIRLDRKPPRRRERPYQCNRDGGQNRSLAVMKPLDADREQRPNRRQTICKASDIFELIARARHRAQNPDDGIAEDKDRRSAAELLRAQSSAKTQKHPCPTHWNSPKFSSPSSHCARTRLTVQDVARASIDPAKAGRPAVSHATMYSNGRRV